MINEKTSVVSAFAFYFVIGDRIKSYFYSFITKHTSPQGRTDLEQKSSADEREAYKGMSSEETAIE